MKNARTDGRKLGEVLAERIENEIIERGWPVGQVLGSEADLIDKYDVSRAVFREAMRIVDHHGVAEMRRGPGGGLVVAAPDLEAVMRTVSLHLEFLRIRPEQINEARMALELAGVRSAERLTDEGRADQAAPRPRGGGHQAHARARPGAWRSPDARLPPAARRLDRQSGDAPVRADGRPGHRGALAPLRVARGTAVEVHRTHQRIAEAILDGDAEPRSDECAVTWRPWCATS